MDQGVAPTNVEYIEVFNGDGPEEKGLLRLGSHAHAQHILCIHHAYLGLIIAALNTRVRGDDSSRGRKLRLRTPVYGLLQRTTVATTWHGVGRSSDCPFAAPDQMPIGDPSWPRQSSLGTPGPPPKRRSRSRTRTLPTTTTTARKNKFAVKRAIKVKQEGQTAKDGNRRRGSETGS